ncbi:MAG: hypothetical protein M1820_003810 [Bogoriella megaspora]|nr:MAG: hypothetical protein M1820_003810 [Bogoriella megaspora]
MSANESLDRSLFLRQQILGQAPIVFNKELKFEVLICHDPAEGAYYVTLIGLKRERVEGMDTSMRVLIRGPYTRLGRIQALELVLGILSAETHTRVEKEMKRIGQELTGYENASAQAYIAPRQFPF